MPRLREAATLSRMRSPITSRSNWAKDSSTFSVSRPMLVVVLKDWVTLTKVTPVLIEHLDQPGEIHQRAAQPVDLVDDHDVDATGLDVGEQALQGRPFERAAGEAAIVVLVCEFEPALGALAGDVGAAGLALGVEAVELHVEPFLGRLARVDGAAELPDEGFFMPRSGGS